MRLTREFYARYSVDDWVRAGPARHAQFCSAEAFLRRLDRQLLRVQNTGDFRAFRPERGFDSEKDGDHLISLVTYMTQNGFEFAGATPGNESAYHTVFAMMRDLYVRVADNDSPGRLTSRVP